MGAAVAAGIIAPPYPQGQWRQMPVSGDQAQPLQVTAANNDRSQLFISYSHADRPWVDRLQKMIRPLVRSEDLQLWDDSRIPPGAKWREEIEKALARAKVALLLVSDDFLASEFVTNKELPPLLEAAEREGLRILWVCLSPCFVEETPISDYQALLSPHQFLDGMSRF